MSAQLEARVCVGCSALFVAVNPRRRYCSEPCRGHHRARRQREVNGEKVRERERRWVQANPDKQRDKTRRWREAHPEKDREKSRRWLEANPDKHREKAHRRRAHKRGAQRVPFTLDQWAAKCAYWGDRCYICGGPVETQEHVKPMSRRGPHMLANLRPACGRCNRRKGNRWPGVAGLAALVLELRGRA